MKNIYDITICLFIIINYIIIFDNTNFYVQKNE